MGTSMAPCSSYLNCVFSWRRRRRPFKMVFVVGILAIFLALCQADSGTSGGGSSFTTNLINGGGSSKSDTFRRTKGLDRILTRLDEMKNGAGSNGQHGAETNHRTDGQTASNFGKDFNQFHHPRRPVDIGNGGMDKHSQARSFPASFTSSSSSPSDVSSLHRTWSTSRKDFIEEEMYDEEDEMDDEDSYEDDQDEMDNTTDGDLLNDKMSHWASNYRNRYLAQRRISTPSTTTTTTTTTTPAPPPAPSYSQWKWQQLGNRQALDQYRRQLAAASASSASTSHSSKQKAQPQRHHHNNHHQSPSPQHQFSSSSTGGAAGAHGSQGSNSNRAQPQTPATAVSEAVRHAWKVRREGDCKIPQPRIVRVQDFYPHPAKSYVPHCTILHHCSDDTGCCRHDVLTCAPKTTQRVELAFYTISLDQSRTPTVERLVFYNHTECECRDKLDELMPRDGGVHPSSLDPYTLHYPPPTSGAKSGLKSLGGSNPILAKSFSNSKRNSIEDQPTTKSSSTTLCKCPSEFTERTLSDGASCSCDCFDKEKTCLRLKRGRDFFPFQDKWCIQSGRCEVPECAYGPYIHLIGRCPRKRERSGETSSWTRYLTQ